MAEIHADVIASVNRTWVKTHDYSLQREDSELRWHGNRPPEEATEVMALGEFYQAHQVLPHANQCLPGQCTKTTQQNQRQTCLSQIMD
ncbi:hypothetical protein JB92DRAFT_3144465 [Gautieria morchelliformis]|nr:hypothetical protein JB92DRAFT_3144465 [Gautieria morchelliformis]